MAKLEMLHKTGLLFVMAIVAVIGILFGVGCEKQEIENPQVTQEVQTQQSPLSIVTAQSRRYMNAEPDSLYMIATQAEYESIFGDYVFDEFQSIDFSNNTLLFIQGPTPNLIGERNENLTFEDNVYTWNINIVVGCATQPDYWGYGALINRKGVSRNSIIINLNVE